MGTAYVNLDCAQSDRRARRDMRSLRGASGASHIETCSKVQTRTYTVAPDDVARRPRSQYVERRRGARTVQTQNLQPTKIYMYIIIVIDTGSYK